jgi:hypothetical protein
VVGVALLHDGKGALLSSLDATLLHQIEKRYLKREMKKGDEQK